MVCRSWLKQVYEISKLYIFDRLANLLKNQRFDYVDENPTYSMDLMRATNLNSDYPFHIAIPWEQQKGKEYFVICDHWSRHKSTKCAKISFHEPKYVDDNLIMGKKKWKLTPDEKELLAIFLNSNLTGYGLKINRWKDIIMTYNNNIGNDEYDIPENLPMPDYTKLPNF